MKSFPLVVLTLVIASSLLTLSCAESDALKIFSDKGLVLLQPAKSYVTVGGLFILGKTGKPAYIDKDPADPLLGNDSVFVPNCSEVFGSETKGQSMGLSAALNGIAKIIPWAGGLKANNQVNVSLDGFTSPCIRLNPRNTAAVVGESISKDYILNQLHKPETKGVYVVIETLSTTSLTLAATTKTALEASYQGQGSLMTCPDPLGDSSPGGAGKKKSTASAAAKSKKGTKTSPTTKPASGDDSGISVSACLNTVYKLTLKSDKPVPFAVRVSQVYERAPGILDVRDTGFKFPLKSLGYSSDLERATAKLDPNLLQGGYERRSRR